MSLGVGGETDDPRADPKAYPTTRRTQRVGVAERRRSRVACDGHDVHRADVARITLAEANLCLAVGSGPWFCTRRCDSGADCPPDHRCYPVADRKECIPLATPYARKSTR